MNIELKVLVIGITFFVLVYLIYFLISIFFMIAFNKKIRVGKEAISILLFQKKSSLLNIISFLDQNELNEDLLNFKNDNINFTYSLIDPSISREIYLEEEAIYKNLINLISKKEDVDSKIKKEINLIEDINKRYFSRSQIYNSNIVGYNYWRNLRFTKLIKRIFQIKEKETIK